MSQASDRASSVWEDRTKYIRRKGRMKEEFDLPPRSPEIPACPVDDDPVEDWSQS